MPATKTTQLLQAGLHLCDSWWALTCYKTTSGVERKRWNLNTLAAQTVRHSALLMKEAGELVHSKSGFYLFQVLCCFSGGHVGQCGWQACMLCDACAWELAFTLLGASELCAQPCLYKQTAKLLLLQKPINELFSKRWLWKCCCCQKWSLLHHV